MRWSGRSPRRSVSFAARARHAFDYPYPSGRTAIFEVEVDPGEPLLGSDDDLDCECPRMIGLTWMPIPTDASSVTGGLPIPVMFFSLQP